MLILRTFVAGFGQVNGNLATHASRGSNYESYSSLAGHFVKLIKALVGVKLFANGQSSADREVALVMSQSPGGSVSHKWSLAQAYRMLNVDSLGSKPTSRRNPSQKTAMRCKED